MNKLATTLLAAGLTVASIFAFAMDEKKGEMHKDDMKKDSMKKDEMKK